eukprot:sb/3478305/
MVYFGILWYIPHIFLRFSIYQSIPKYTKVCHGNPPGDSCPPRMPLNRGPILYMFRHFARTLELNRFALPTCGRSFPFEQIIVGGRSGPPRMPLNRGPTVYV